MPLKLSSIHTAKISFNKDGSPTSDEFSDIYFDHNAEFSQSEQVFLNGNDIPNIWHSLPQNQKTFTILETGFGTGLNFLLTLKTFIKFKKQTQSDLKLHFISTEKFPLKKADLSRALSLWPEFKAQSEALLKQYQYDSVISKPMLFLHDSVSLQIYFCDSTQALEKIHVPEHSLNQGIVDAFYLDGFAPSRNPDMWKKPLFEQLARVAKRGASLSTFTVAGQVKRDLASVGFKLKKLKHDTIKSETLTANFIGFREGKPLAGYKIRPAIIKPQHVSIVGGGLSSACMALALVKRGIRVTIYCQDSQVAQGASSNAIGAIYPLLHQKPDTISQFYQQGFEHALTLYKSLLEQGYHFSHGFNGLIDVCYKEALVNRQQVFTQQNCWPEDLIKAIDADTVNELSNITVNHPGLLYPRAGWVCPPELVQAILTAAKDSGLCKIKTNHQIRSIKPIGTERWLLTSNKGQKQVQHLVLCPGADGLKMPILDDIPLTQVRGQVSQMQSNQHIESLKTVLCHKGYLTPQNNGVHCIGATFEKNTDDIKPRNIDDEYNLNMLTKCLGNLANWQSKDVIASKARLRCCTPDHLPIVGSLPNIELHKQYYAHLGKDKHWHIDAVSPVKTGLYVLTGLGARGLSSASLLADILASELCDEPSPVDEEMLFNLAPNRFIIRDIIRRKFI